MADVTETSPSLGLSSRLATFLSFAPLSATAAAVFDGYADWRAAETKPGIRLWTDDFSNIASVLD